MQAIEPARPLLTGASAITAKDRIPPVRVIVEVRDSGRRNSELVVSTHDGSRHTLPLPFSARRKAADEEIPALHRPLAARFEMSDQGVSCTCLASTPDGPRRISISVPAALSLVRDGLHGIVTSAPPAAWPEKLRLDAADRRSKPDRSKLQIRFECDRASLDVQPAGSGGRTRRERIVVRNVGSELIMNPAVEIDAIGEGIPPPVLPHDGEQGDLPPFAEMTIPVVVHPAVASAWVVRVTGQFRSGEPFEQCKALWVL